MQRSVLLLKKNNGVQRISVLTNLASIIRDHPEAQDELLPMIFKDILSWDEEMQVEGGASLAVIIEENLLTREMNELLYKFMLEALESWNNAKWDVVGEHYINHIDTIIEDEDQRVKIMKQLVDLTLSLGELSQAIPSRGTGARLMAIISNIIDQETAKKRLLSKMKLLCRDFNWEVRKAITTHISKIFNLLDRSESDKHMFDIIVELLDDEENEVKNLAIIGFLENIDNFSDSKIEESCLEILTEIIKNEANKDLLIEKLDHALEISVTLRNFLSTPEYLEHPEEEFRNKIFINMHHITQTLGTNYFIENVYDKYKLMLKSEDEQVRTKLAENIHELITIFETEGGYKHEFEKGVTIIMNDKSSSVGGAMLTYLDKIVQILMPYEITDQMKEDGYDKKISNFKLTFSKNYTKMEEVVRQNWRHVVRWIDGLYKIMDNLEHSNVIRRFLPVILTHLKKSGKEARHFGILFLCQTMKPEFSSSFKREVFDVAATLPFAPSSFTRMIYIEFVNVIVDYISKKLFCSKFLDSYYILSKDKGANVIIKFASVAPNIYKKVSYEDSRNKERMINIMKTLMDCDRFGDNYVGEFVKENYK